MEISRRDRGGIVILDIVGEITLYDAPKLKKFIGDLADEDLVNVLLNFAKVDYIDSSGLGVLIASMTRLKKKHGILKFCRVSENIQTLFSLTKLQNLFEVHAEEDSAVDSFD